MQHLKPEEQTWSFIFTCSLISSLYWVIILSCCSNVFFTSSSFFSSSEDLWTALVIRPVRSREKSFIFYRNSSDNTLWTRTDLPDLWPAWWTRGQTASAPETGKPAVASAPPGNTAHVWWWSRASPQSFPSRCVSLSAALASPWTRR